MNLNFMLTEISLQLLGNKFYDINGRETDNLKDLFSAHSSLRSHPINGQQKRTLKTKGNLMQMIGMPGLNSVQKNTNDYVDSQYRGFMDNQRARNDAMSQTEAPATNPAQVQKDLCEMRIKTQQEFVRIVGHSKKMKDIYLDTLPADADRDWEFSKYNEEERNLLINEYNRLLYMLKHILADVNDRSDCEQIAKIIEGIKETLKHL
ncbi:uncharacterized protein LOC135698568 [Ochlerotatus camptorhynchus]|uniref:uncharacterized protein LOC135698568 n=1 Tax=Ochlerotatus camptorhynchus TaxID=644619 RepID=UPI0031D72B5C